MMFIRKSTHDRAMDAHMLTEVGLLERITRLEVQLKAANERDAQKARMILALEDDLSEKSIKITTLSNLNTALKRKYEPVRGPNGQFQSRLLKQVGAGA